MLRLFLILAVAMLANAADPSLDAEWEDFKQRYGKAYTETEEVCHGGF